MTIQEQYFKLRSDYVGARSRKEKEMVFDELSRLIAAHPAELAEAYEQGVHDLMDKSRLASFRKELRGVLKTVTARSLAARIGKSPAWLSQRLNGNTVNGEESVFSEEDMRRITEAVRQTGRELSAFEGVE